MDGDIAPLHEICALAAEHGALTYLDETHAAGAYGHEGAGVAQALGAADAVTIVQGSLAKGYGTLGGFIAGPASVIDSVRSHASGFIFTTSLPPGDRRRGARERAPPARVRAPSAPPSRAACASCATRSRAPASRRCRARATSSRCSCPAPSAAARSPQRLLDEHAIYVQPINYPSVPRGAERLRIAPTPAHAPGARRGARARRARPHCAAACASASTTSRSRRRDLARSTRFYEQLFGCEQLPVPDVGFPTVWLSLGDRQLHLFERDTAVPPLHHFAVAVDDFAEACRRAEALGAFEGAPYGREAYRLPDGTVQLFLRDPDGHLVEVDGAPGAGERRGRPHRAALGLCGRRRASAPRATLFQTGIPFTNGAGPA